MRTRVPAVFALCIMAVSAPDARADDGNTSGHQASKHFQRGVTLYGEADYRGALVEFKRAHAIAPNPAVLYNVGETQYQLQDYAGALTTFEHFLAEASPTDAHRAEVEGDLDVLRARVAHVNVTTIPAGAEVTVDDQPAGKTPLEHPLLVSIGHRKILASMGGRPAVTRYVDVAADDNVTVTLELPNPPEVTPAAVARLEPAARPVDSETPSHPSDTLRVLGWTATGALAAGATTFGILAMSESRELARARASFPTSSQALAHDASLTTTFSVVADSLGIAAVALGGTTLVSTLLSHPVGPTRGSSETTRIVLGPASMRVEGTF